MGMYTELIIKAEICCDLPLEVGFILNFLFNHDMEIDIWDKKMNIRDDVKLPDHEFFKCPRWTQIGRSNSYYHIPKTFGYFDGFYLFSRSDLKNYDKEIDYFIDWISPYLNGDSNTCIGWSWYEESNEPNLIYKKSNEEK